MVDRIRRLLSDTENISLVKNITGAFTVKGLSLVVSLFTMPAYMSFFDDQEMLGVWFTLLSVMNWILNLDLGIGNGLRNKLAISIATNDDAKSKEYISSAYFIVGVVSIAFAILLTGVVYLVNWNGFFSIPETLISLHDLRSAVLICLVGIILQFFLRLISSILYALQKSAINNFLALLTSVGQLVFVLIIPSSSSVANLKVFSLVHGLCVNVPLLIATAVVFWKFLPNCRPSRSQFRFSQAKDVISLGGIFFICQILYMVIANTNEFFISHFFGAEHVVEYQIYNRLFSMASMITSLALSPVWSAVTRAKAQNNIIWLKKLYRTFKLIGFMGICGEFLLVPLLQLIIRIWLGDNAIAVDYTTALMFALFGSAMLYQGVLSTFVCGFGRMRLQTVFYFIGVVFKICFIPMVVNSFAHWEAVLIANIIILLPYCVAQQIELDSYIKKLLKAGKNELSVINCHSNKE